MGERWGRGGGEVRGGEGEVGERWGEAGFLKGDKQIGRIIVRGYLTHFERGVS